MAVLRSSIIEHRCPSADGDRALTRKLGQPLTAPSPTLTFNVVWRAALKSERLGPRRRLIKRLRAATRPSAINKSTWSRPQRLVKLVSLRLLEWELRLQKTAAFKSFAAAAKMRPKANGASAAMTTKKESKPSLRPAEYTHEIGSTICDRLFGGETLSEICRDTTMPDRPTVMRWLAQHPKFLDEWTFSYQLLVEELAADQHGELLKPRRPPKLRPTSSLGARVDDLLKVRRV